MVYTEEMFKENKSQTSRQGQVLRHHHHDNMAQMKTHTEQQQQQQQQKCTEQGTTKLKIKYVLLCRFKPFCFSFFMVTIYLNTASK